MKLYLRLILASFLISHFTLVFAEAPRVVPQILDSIPHEKTHFTQGLFFDGNDLIESTGLYGKSGLYRRTLDGKILDSARLEDKYFGEGSIAVGDDIFYLTWKSKKAFIYSRKPFAKKGEFSIPTEGWGLTNNGLELIMSDGTEKIQFIDTTTLQVTRTIEVYDTEGPVTELNELEFVDGLIYANIYCTDNIVAIDPESGKILKIIDMRNLLDESKLTQRVDVLNGIAYQKTTGRWFVTGKLWPTMFQVEFVGK